MIVVILLWVLIVVLLVIWVLKHAREDSHETDFFYNIDGEHERKPRSVSTQVAYRPTESPARKMREEQQESSTSENKVPVYVNAPSVVEIRGLSRTPDEHEDGSQRN